MIDIDIIFKDIGHIWTLRDSGAEAVGYIGERRSEKEEEEEADVT